MSVTVEKSGNLIKVTPPCEEILANHLTYDHRSQEYGKAAKGKRSIVVTATRIYSVIDGSLYVQRGVVDTVLKALSKAGKVVTFRDLTPSTLEADFGNIKRRMPDLELRSGQDYTLAQIATRSNGQIEAPTGWGKTTVMGMVCAMYPDAKILICTPGLQLAGNTMKRLRETFGTEVGQCHSKAKEKGRIILSTFGSIKQACVLMGEPPDIIMVDECHKAAAPSFSSALSEITGYSKIFGLTATPEGRSDGAELVNEALLGPVIVNIGYDDMVDEDAVCKIRVAAVDTGGAVSGPSLNNAGSGVYRKRHGYWRNLDRNRLVAEAVNSIHEHYPLRKDPQILILVDTIEHANNIAAELPDFTLVHGERDKAIKDEASDGMTCEQVRERFETGELKRVIATGMWGTGVDFVQLDVLIYASGSPSHITTTQWAGRNSRVREDKDFGLVVDFNDKWDGWAHSRFIRRIRSYKQHGWKIDNIRLKPRQVQTERVL